MAGKGSFIWYELASPDVAASEAFYASVVGWTPQPFEGGAGYTVLNSASDGVGGIMALQPGGKPGWTGYIGVADTDAAAESIRQAGGAVHYGPDDIPGVGRFAVVADPQGVGFSLLTPSTQGDRPTPPPETPGHIGWHELHTTDWEAAFGFYSEQFGWVKDQAMDMGAMGTYQLFADGGRQVGAMFNSPDMPAPTWLFYFNVASTLAAVDRIKAGGGQVLMGPHEVPGGGLIVQATDPQGIMFAIVGPTSEKMP
jgi:predicted enzyme related to lactoylglutathione lyase